MKTQNGHLTRSATPGLTPPAKTDQIQNGRLFNKGGHVFFAKSLLLIQVSIMKSYTRFHQQKFFKHWIFQASFITQVFLRLKRLKTKTLLLPPRPPLPSSPSNSSFRNETKVLKRQKQQQKRREVRRDLEPGKGRKCI